MKQIPYFILLFFSAAFPLSTHAQPLLPLEEAIEIALKSNHQIQLQRLDADIRQKEAHPSLVGKKARVDINASYELGYSDASIETLPLGPGGGENQEINLDGISNDVIISPEISLLLLDGKASTYRLQQLQTAHALSEVALRQTVEQTVFQLSVLYLNIAQQESIRGILEDNLQLTRDRLKRTQEDNRFGTSTSLQALQISVDLKADSTKLRQLELAIGQLKRNFNQLLGRDANTNFSVQSSFNYAKQLSLAELEEKVRQENSLIRLQEKNIQLAEYSHKISQAAFKPSLSAYGNLNFVYLQDNANFLQSTRTIGPNLGVRLRYPIFDGGARRIRSSTALMEVQKSKLEEERIREELMRDLYNTFAQYQNSLEELRIEGSNLPVFEKNLAFLQDNFFLGLANNTDVRTAQVQLNALQNRINNYQYEIKEAELRLYLLSGQLLN
ncbi:MAG: TolC family protein [Bacteroidota bacterium]